jgi:hypothetical protein
MAKFLEDMQKENPKQVAIYYKNFVVHEGAILEHERQWPRRLRGNFGLIMIYFLYTTHRISGE